MKNILIVIFSLLIYNSGFSQKKPNHMSKLNGIWIGKMDETLVKFEFLKNKKSFTFSDINSDKNSHMRKFNIEKSEVTINEKNETVIEIKEANISPEFWGDCKFSKGTIVISNLLKNRIILNLKSVGPDCFKSYDESLVIENIENLELTKK